MNASRLAWLLIALAIFALCNLAAGQEATPYTIDHADAAAREAADRIYAARRVADRAAADGAAVRAAFVAHVQAIHALATVADKAEYMLDNATGIRTATAAYLALRGECDNRIADLESLATQYGPIVQGIQDHVAANPDDSEAAGYLGKLTKLTARRAAVLADLQAARAALD